MASLPVNYFWGKYRFYRNFLKRYKVIRTLKGLLNSIRKSHNKLSRDTKFQEKPILEYRDMKGVH